MKTKGKQDALALHPSEPGCEFDLADSKAVPSMEGPIHVWVREGAKVLWMLLPYVRCGHRASRDLARRGCIGVEDTGILPFLLIPFFNLYQSISLFGLGMGRQILAMTFENYPLTFSSLSVLSVLRFTAPMAPFVAAIAVVDCSLSRDEMCKVQNP